MRLSLEDVRREVKSELAKLGLLQSFLHSRTQIKSPTKIQSPKIFEQMPRRNRELRRYRSREELETTKFNVPSEARCRQQPTNTTVATIKSNLTDQTEIQIKTVDNSQMVMKMPEDAHKIKEQLSLISQLESIIKTYL